MRLEELIQDLEISRLHGEVHPEIAGLTHHSEQVSAGGLFVAIKGSHTDGHDFVRQAIHRRAHAVVVQKPFDPIPGVTIVEVPNTRAALALISNRFYGSPSQKLTVIGITGTNGKTTTTYLLESILAACGKRVGVIGTVNVRYPGYTRPAAITTPDSLDLQRTFKEMLDGGVTHVVLEVSSHGLDLHRVDGTRFAVGLFTNLSRDHLDFHGSLESYFGAKSLLFSRILQKNGDFSPLAVVNGDDAWGQKLCSKITGPLLCYGLATDADIRASEVQCNFSGIKALIHTPIGDLAVHSPLLGRINLYNLLAATSVAVNLDLPPEQITVGLQTLSRVPGRLESIPNNMGFQVLVDYAHTPDALEKALESLRELQFRRTICVFGCGGDRDRGKRPLMGEAAAKGADFLVITSDNPRSEVPEIIMADIEAGITPLGFPRLDSPVGQDGNCQSGYTLVPDRGEAIRLAIDLAGEKDVVYIGGKGHEDYQILADQRIDFDDRRVAAQALAERQEREDAKR